MLGVGTEGTKQICVHKIITGMFYTKTTTIKNIKNIKKYIKKDQCITAISKNEIHRNNSRMEYQILEYANIFTKS